MPSRRETSSPLRVLIVGGGLAALEAMLALRHLAGDRVRTAIVSPQRDFIYRPLAVAEAFGLRRTRRFDLGALTESAGAELVAAKMVGVEPERRRILIDDGEALSYDALVLTCGARPQVALPGAITFWGRADRAAVAKLIADLESGAAERVAFAAHVGVGWQLPVYQLALLTDAHLRRAGIEGRRLSLVTPEAAPLELFGREASERVRGLLEARGIELLTGRHPSAVREGALEVAPAGSVPADRVVTMPRLAGPDHAGLPADENGFIPVDALGHVPGIPDVHAAGDVTTFPVKHGGLATQQADALATAIAARAGAPVEPEPYHPVLRGLLVTGTAPASGPDGPEEASGAGAEVLWWSSEVAGRFLLPHLAEIAGRDLEPAPPPSGATTAVEVELSEATYAAENSV